MILITENGKYGFANSKGEIVIKPSYDCASSFYEGMAKVSNDCSEGEDEHERWKMNTWFEIDKKGNVVK
ncbi:WG repeat-containing protein [Bergeyella sp. RCAD1439]|uniref:WG repeat-containing protein n=1 Tax=Bergeyella anatis TaxID=3113737 RepID=UPI002E1888F3|nr:WG repeat-containing protein [Bergeyella sp. RCAD1439]